MNGVEVPNTKDAKVNQVLQRLWDDIVKESYFDMNRVLDLYKYKESKACPKDLGDNIEEIVGKIQQIILALNEINLNVRKETNYIVPYIRSLSLGTRSTSPDVLKCITTAKALFYAYQKYKSNMMFCYNSCKSQFKSISTEVNELMTDLSEVIKKGTDLSTESIRDEKQDVAKFITKIDEFRDVMTLFIDCAEKATVSFQEVQNEFNTAASKIKLPSRL